MHRLLNQCEKKFVIRSNLTLCFRLDLFHLLHKIQILLYDIFLLQLGLLLLSLTICVAFLCILIILARSQFGISTIKKNMCMIFAKT